MQKLQLSELEVHPFTVLDNDWALLVAGSDHPNPMTVSWGGMGTLWHKPTVTIYVRPTRHTFKLLNDHPEFTLNFLSKEFKGAMEACGSQSGRDIDKWTETGLTTEPSDVVSVPRVKEAQLVFECRTMAYQDLDPDQFLSKDVNDEYPMKDYHRVYWGQVECAWKA